jgi:hypothetical protein
VHGVENECGVEHEVRPRSGNENDDDDDDDNDGKDDDFEDEEEDGNGQRELERKVRWYDGDDGDTTELELLLLLLSSSSSLLERLWEIGLLNITERELERNIRLGGEEDVVWLPQLLLQLLLATAEGDNKQEDDDDDDEEEEVGLFARPLVDLVNVSVEEVSICRGAGEEEEERDDDAFVEEDDDDEDDEGGEIEREHELLYFEFGFEFEFECFFEFGLVLSIVIFAKPKYLENPHTGQCIKLAYWPRNKTQWLAFLSVLGHTSI